MMIAVDVPKATMGLEFDKFTENVSVGSMSPSSKRVMLTHCLVMESENCSTIITSS